MLKMHQLHEYCMRTQRRDRKFEEAERDTQNREGYRNSEGVADYPITDSRD